MRATFHQGYGHVFTYSAGDDYEGYIAPRFLQNAKSGGRIEAGHAVVGDNQVPGGFSERAPQFGGVLHSLVNDIVAAQAKLANDQFAIAFGVFYEQYFERITHGSTVGQGRAGGSACPGRACEAVRTRRFSRVP